MRQGLAALDLHYLVKEFQGLISGKIDKIYQKKDRYLFQLHVPGKGKHYLKVYLPNFIFLSDYKENYEEPGKFAFALRRHISNARIRAIEQKEFERILEFTLQTKDSMYRLIIELFSPGNIILCNEDYKIIIASEYKGFGSRVIRPGITYEYPKQKHNILALDEGSIQSLFDESEKSSVVVTLAVNLGLGGMYAEEACLRADIDKKQSALSDSKKSRLLKTLKDMTSMDIDATKYYEEKIKDITPFELLQYKDLRQKKGETLSDVWDSYLTKKTHRKKKQKVISRYEKARAKLERIIEQQKAQTKGLKISARENQKKGELIYENYTKIDALIKKIREQKKEKSWKALEEEFPEIDAQSKTITLDL